MFTAQEFKSKRMSFHEIPELPWTKIGCDIFEINGKPHIAVIDYYSKFIEMSRIHDKLSATIIKTLKSIFARHGIPIEYAIQQFGVQAFC